MKGHRQLTERFYSAHDYEALILGLTGLRLREVLPLLRSDFDGHTLTIRCSAHEGELVESSDQKNHEREVPVPPSLARPIGSQPTRIDTGLLYPTPRGEMWRERNF